VSVDWSGTTVSYPGDKCIHELFETQVKNNPDAIAVVYENQQLTYTELNKKANQLAHYLVNKKQIKPDTLVGVCVERSLEMVIAVIGILKAGGAYVPLDPYYPAARLSYMLADSNVKTVLTLTHLLTSLPIKTEQALCLDDDSVQQNLAQESIHNLAPQQLGLHSHHLAYVIYTSGSTGNPKGSLLEHTGLCNLAIAQQKGFGVTPTSRVLQFASMAFDAAISEIAVTLCAGAQLIVVSNTTIKTITELEATIQTLQVTHATLPPALLPLLNPSAWQSVRTLVIAGDTCSIQVANQWAENRTLINAYGPSEATVCATMGQYRYGQECLHIGKPLQNIQVYVLDENLKLLAEGIAGELHIGGVGLSRGYLNRDDLTAQKFIPNPFYDKQNISSSTRLYKTGDLVRWLPDGNLEFLGRIDNQIKIRGFRVELGEIENSLVTHDGIKDAIVLAKTSSHDDKFLVGYVLVDNELMQAPHAATIESLRQHLGHSLPDYMIPARFVLLESFPITPNGKIDRKALPEPDMGNQQEYIPPRTDFEKDLCLIWQHVLEIERVGIFDNFFQLGGHSLKAIKLITKMQTLGVDILVKELIQSPTIAEISAIAKQKESANQYHYQYTQGDKIYSLPNRQLLFKNAYHNHWNIDGIINIENADSAILEQALRAVISEHQGLRSVFYLENEMVCERIADLPNAPLLEVIDLSGYESQEARSTQIEALATQMQATLDLTKKLYRFILFFCGNDSPARFVWIIHHSIIDGYSIGIFVQELLIRYAALVANEVCKLPRPTTPVVEWGHYLHHYINSRQAKEQINYWTSLAWDKVGALMDFPEGLKKNKSHDKTLYGNDFNVTKKLNATYSASLLAGNWKHTDITAADIIFTGFVNTIATLTNSRFVNFEMAVSGREKIVHRVDLSRTIGWLIDDIPVFIEMQTNLTPYEKVKLYNQQYQQIPDSGLSFNAFKHLSDDSSIRNTFHEIPRAEFNINYVPPAVNGLHDADLDIEQLAKLPFNIFSHAHESRGEPYNVKDIQISWPSYIQIDFIAGEFIFFWFTRDNIYKKNTVELALSSWINEIESMLDSFHA